MNALLEAGSTLLGYGALLIPGLRLRWGVIPAAVAHGLAIFVLSSGLI